MGERLPSDEALDALIEAALSEDVFLPVPVGLQEKINERIQLAALQQREQTRFRNAMLTGLAAAVGVVSALVAIVASTKFDVLLKHGVSGGQGLLDYYTATFALAWPQYMDGLVFALLLCLGTATVSAGLLPWRGRGSGLQGNTAGKTAIQGPLQMQ